MAGLDVISFAYAASLIIGGIIGYVKAGSVPSLVAGVGCGSLMAFGAYQTTNDPKNFTLSLVTVSMLSVVMGYRFYSSGMAKFMPAGLITFLSLLMVARFGFRAHNTQ